MFFRSILAVTLSAVAFVYAADVTREVKARILLSALSFVAYCYADCSIFVRRRYPLART